MHGTLTVSESWWDECTNKLLTPSLTSDQGKQNESNYPCNNQALRDLSHWHCMLSQISKSLMIKFMDNTRRSLFLLDIGSPWPWLWPGVRPSCSPHPWSAAESARTWAPRPRTRWPRASRGSCKTSWGHWSASARVGQPQLLENIERIITSITPLLMFNIWRFLNRGGRIYLSFVSWVG